MNKVKIFLASSAELNIDKEQIELFISRKNKDWHEKRIFIELSTWKDFISSMTEGRTQDEYNKYIRSCDIAIFLFSTKLGRFTKEEFDHAHEAFLECKGKVKKPRIYTYFKTDEIETSGLIDFRKYIDSLDHFYDTYESMDNLLVKFDRQLDKLENERKLIIPESIDVPKIIKYAVYSFILPLLILTGAFLSFYYFQPANITVKIFEINSNPNLPFKAGKVSITYGDKTDVMTIKDEVVFKQIPSKYKRGGIKLHFDAQGYEDIDTSLIASELISLPIKRNNSLSLIFGWVRDENGIPIKDVHISVKELKSLTDENGDFKIIIPIEQQAETQKLSAFKQGFHVWEFTSSPSLTEKWEIILKKW